MSNRILSKLKVSLSPVDTHLEDPNSKNLQKIMKSQERLKENSCKPISAVSAIISHTELGVFYPNTINVIQGKKGVHKSRITEIFSALLLAKKLGNTFLGFQRNAQTQFSVLYIDTERNHTEQFPSAIQKIKKMAGYEIEEEPPNFDYISLIDIERAERFDATQEYFEHFRQSNPSQHLFVVFDVVTDCVKNFNDVTECLKFIDMLNQAINEYDVTFLCVIHENPALGNDKGRGHLGTELINKASQVLQIGFEKDNKNNDTDLIRLKCLHARNTKKLEAIYLEYSKEANGLVVASAEFIEDKLALKQEKASIPEVEKWLNENIGDGMTKAQLLNNLTEHFDCSKRTIEDRLSEIIENDEILIKDKKGREVFYKSKIPF